MLNKFKNPDLGILLIRIGLAAVFILHGLSKFSNIEGTEKFFGSLGLPIIFVYLVALVETLGGLALLLGIFTEVASILIAGIMIFAILLVKLQKGFVGGYEFELMLFLSALAITLIGPGKYKIKKSS